MAEKIMQILVSGSLAYDRIMDFPGCFSDHILPDKIHSLSVSFVADTLSENYGGCAGNIAYSLAALGEKPVVLAAAGRDFGEYREHLERCGVDLQFVTVVPDKVTMTVTVMTDKKHNQIASVYLGTMADPSSFNPEDTSNDFLKNAFAIIAPGNLEDMRRLPGVYREKGIEFMYDPGQAIPTLSTEELKDGIRGSRVCITNDYELALICEKTGWKEEDILKETEMLVTTLGEKGSRILTREGVIEIPSAKVERILDPTGAGDAYRAGFIKGLIAGWPVETVGRFAGTVAAYAIEHYGTQKHVFTYPQVKARYEKEFGERLPEVA